MGMDLVAISPSSSNYSGFHMNWTGWSVFANLIAQLGCDTSQLSGSNDGEVVDEKTAKQWSMAIDNNIDKIAIVSVKNENYAGGYQSVYKVLEDVSGIGKISTSELELLNGSKEVVKLLEDSEDDYNWLKEASAFLRNSGGFAQY